VKLAVVVQRYGAGINGGAELHARYVAERLNRHHEVEVLTTCAVDYVSWRNDLPAGVETVNGLTVRRFPVEHERSTQDFGRRSQHVFDRVHSVADELAWLDSEGPASRALVRFVRDQQASYDYFIFFSFRYYHAYHGPRAVARRALLVPTAERDPAVGVSVFAPVFRGVRAIMYNSFEERRMIQAVAGTRDTPGVVVGVGSEIPGRTEPGRFREAFGLRGPFVIYVGRIDENKGCPELFTFFRHYVRTRRSPLTLVLIGNSILKVPDHPQVRHLGFLPDRDKFDGIAAAEALIMPSYYESLSMVALEAWALGRPVIANAHCEVLRGQCIRSNAGLYYETFEEFAAALDMLESHRALKVALGRNGSEYFGRHYAWSVIERKYLEMLEHLKQQERDGAALPVLERLPGWLARHRRTVPPAREILAALPEGPVVPAKQSRHPARPSKRAS
jgi:glycosyltransferase involved in cell wall biosynthesis